MGDAFVAVADDASAFYWNPAGLSLYPDEQEIHWATARQGSGDLAFTDLDVMFDVVSSREIGPGAFELLQNLADDRVFVEASAFMGYRTGRWALGVFAQALTATDIVREAEDRISLDGWGMDITMVGVAYGESFDEKLHWGLQAGKLYSGRGFARGDVLRSETGETINEVDQNTEHAETWSATAGLLYLHSENLRVGLVSRNFISPELVYGNGDRVQYDPAFDVGLAWIDEEQGLIVSADLHNATKANQVGCHAMAGVEKQLSPDLYARLGANASSVFGGIGWMAGSIALDATFGADPSERLMLTIRSPL
ncbi:MAG: hypothetical protein GF393_05920 [Armatimonadia bacterium]|nr:hypothetical protein [Armatimonadia bacterium]